MASIEYKVSQLKEYLRYPCTELDRCIHCVAKEQLHYIELVLDEDLEYLKKQILTQL